MSDFASLLGDLKKTAKRASQEKKEVTTSNCIAGQKRRREDHDDTSTANSKKAYSLPRDASELSVKVSFMCIGAQKAGTSWLHEMLQKSPDLALPRQKEVHFWDWHRHKGLRWYSQQFQSSCIVGEITPCYMTLTEANIAEIKLLFPDLKVIFVARDLVERAWSALVMELRNAVQGLEAGEFGTAKVDERQRAKMEQEADPSGYDDDYFIRRLQHSTHAKRNDYAGGLQRWLKFFPKDQLVILNYRDIKENPRQLLKETLEHIGANVDYLDSMSNEELSTRINAGKATDKSIRPPLLKKMKKELSKPAQEMNNLLKELGYKWRLNTYA